MTLNENGRWWQGLVKLLSVILHKNTLSGSRDVYEANAIGVNSQLVSNCQIRH